MTRLTSPLDAGTSWAPGRNNGEKLGYREVGFYVGCEIERVVLFRNLLSS